MSSIEPTKTFRTHRMLCHMLRALGYARIISFDSFRKPNFKLVADILYWLCVKLDPSTEISANINGEAERVFFVRNTLGLLIAKVRINVNPKNVYYADYRAIGELYKIVEVLYRGLETDTDNSESTTDFSLPQKFDKRKTKELAKEITASGQKLYELLSRENELKENRDKAIVTLEAVLKDYNTSPGSVEKHIRKLITDQLDVNAEMEGYVKALEQKERDLVTKTSRKRMDIERFEKKLKMLSNMKPAYVEEMERYERELERLFQVYLDKYRNLDYLEQRYDKINQEEKSKNKDLLNHLEKMQAQIKKNEEKMFENNIDDIEVRNMNKVVGKFNLKNDAIMEDRREEDEDYMF